MKSVFVFIAAVLMASCAKLEFDELTDYPVADVTDPVSNVNVNTEGGGWEIHSLYFMDRDTWKVRAKYRKELHEPRWSYYELDSVMEYKVLSDAAHPFLMQKTYESDEVAKTFTCHGDTIRIHHCGYYPVENPLYALLVVTKKDGKYKSHDWFYDESIRYPNTKNNDIEDGQD